MSLISNTLDDISSAIGLSSSKDSNNKSTSNKDKTKKTGIKAPIQNVLHSYASYSYVIGLGVLTPEQLNHPDIYMTNGGKILLILKDGNSDPNNRVKTAFGKFDFFINDLELDQTIGLISGNTTNVNNIKFKVIEPYSIGMFTKSLMQGAFDSGHPNWAQAPFILTIEFRGMKENGMMENIKNTKRYIPIKLNTINMSVNESGSIYDIEANAYPESIALDDRYSRLKTDISIKGSTVQEILQTGEKSLQVTINKQLKSLKDEGLISYPDQIVILFPNDITKDKDKNVQTNQKATTDTKNKSVFNTIGVKNVKDNYIQDPKNCNELGKSSFGYGQYRKANAPMSNEADVYDDKGNLIRAKMNINQTIGNMNFGQGMDIMSVIDVVMLNSYYPINSLKKSNTEKSGVVKWWRIETQVYIINNDDIDLSTLGLSPKLIVYNVLPYDSYLSSGPIAPNTKSPELDDLYKNAIKEYNYIYTGKNIDVIKFDINYNATMSSLIMADLSKESEDIKQKDNLNSSTEKENNTFILIGDVPIKGKYTNQNSVSYSLLSTKKDKLGGGGEETSAMRVAKVFHDTMSKTLADMINLEMEIIGDPFYIAQSGICNYIAGKTEHRNLHDDFSVNFRNGEVNIAVNFRTPVDIDNTTGLYNFGKKDEKHPELVTEFSGAYHITGLKSHFKDGTFTQTLVGNRRPGFELPKPKEKKPEQTYSTDNIKEKPQTDNSYTSTTPKNNTAISNSITPSLVNITTYTKTTNPNLNSITPNFGSIK